MNIFSIISEKFRKSGEENNLIYIIRCKANNKVYIGQAQNKKRTSHHFSSLRNNKHFNSLLQDDFNKYGEDSFSVEYVEFCSSYPEIGMVEKEWIRSFSKDECYNFAFSKQDKSGKYIK